MPMYNPPHPGVVILEEILKPLNLTISEAARRLDLNRNSLSRVLHGKRPVTPEIAIRLEMAFKPSAESWIRQQAAYDLWQARQKSRKPRVFPFDGQSAASAH